MMFRNKPPTFVRCLLCSTSLASGGYSYNFVEPIPDRLVCRICHLPCREAQLTRCCRHVCCKLCFGKSKLSVPVKAPACPICHDDAFKARPHLEADHEIHTLNIYCLNEKDGCKWTGQMASISEHLKCCEVACRKCQATVHFAAMKSHHDNSCPCYCRYCEVTAERRVINSQHKEKCSKFPLSCPNKCGVNDIPRDGMVDHQKMCPLEIIQCECGAFITRDSIDRHNVEKMTTHMKLSCEKTFANIVSELRDDISQTRKSMQDYIGKKVNHRSPVGSHLIMTTLCVIAAILLAILLYPSHDHLIDIEHQITKLYSSIQDNTDQISLVDNRLRSLHITEQQLTTLLGNLTAHMTSELTNSLTTFIDGKFNQLQVSNDRKCRELLQTKLSSLHKQFLQSITRGLANMSCNISALVTKGTNEVTSALLHHVERYASCSNNTQERSQEEGHEQVSHHEQDGGCKEQELVKKLMEENSLLKVSNYYDEMLQAKSLIEQYESDLKSVQQEMSVAKRAESKLLSLSQEVYKSYMSSKSNDPLWSFMLFMSNELSGQVAPIIVHISNFTETKNHKEVKYSTPFFTFEGGHQMCLTVYAAGYGNGEGTHISVYLYLMKGPHDDELELSGHWPLRGRFVVELLNQVSDNHHYSVMLQFDDHICAECASRVVDGDKADTGLGQSQFISHNALLLENNNGYFINDSLFFRIFYEDAGPPNQVAPVNIRMNQFSLWLKREVKWNSAPFFAFERGYQMYLRIDSSGIGDGDGTHMSVYLYLTKGPHDDELEQSGHWPLRGTFTIELLNQQGTSDHSSSLVFSALWCSECTNRVMEGVTAAKGWGLSQYISHQDIGDNGYLREDSLYFRISYAESGEREILIILIGFIAMLLLCCCYCCCKFCYK